TVDPGTFQHEGMTRKTRCPHAGSIRLPFEIAFKLSRMSTWDRGRPARIRTISGRDARGSDEFLSQIPDPKLQTPNKSQAPIFDFFWRLALWRLEFCAAA